MRRVREVLSVCRRWIAGEPTLPLTDQLFHTLTALAGLLCLGVVIPVNLFQDISPWINRGVFVFAVISLATSWMATRGRYFRKSYVAGLICLLDLIWFPNAGSHASIGLYFFPTVLLIVALFESRWRIWGVVLLVIDLFALHVVEWQEPQWLIPFATQTDRFLDLSIGYVISLGMCVVILGVIVKGFRLERTRSLAAMQALAEKESERQKYEVQALRNERIESLGALAGGVAHDMNNVLGAIMGLTSVHLAQAPAGSVLHNDLATIMKACQRGGAMVRGLLGFARENLPVKKEVNLNAVVTDAVLLLERTTLQKVTLLVELEPALYRLNGDQAALAPS
jgi:signal transduction histidine kinase